MARYVAKKTRPLPKRIILIFLLVVAVAVIGAVFVRHKYDSFMQPVSTNQTTQIFTVKQDSSVKQIADNLQDAHLIRSSWAFQLYVQRKDQATQLQAGTYALSPSESTPEIVSTLTTGRVTTRLVTILPGRRIDQ